MVVRVILILVGLAGMLLGIAWNLSILFTVGFVAIILAVVNWIFK